MLLLPLLHMLYTASGRAPSHLYMLLIILLLLTQDASFAANVHKVQLSTVPWYKERLLNRTLLGKTDILPQRRSLQAPRGALRRRASALSVPSRNRPCQSVHRVLDDGHVASVCLSPDRGESSLQGAC